MQEIKTMIKEQKEELVKMDWREIIIKRKQIKDKSRQKPQIRMAGGNPQDTGKGREGSIFDMEEDRLERKELANATREDLIDKMMKMVSVMSDEELIDILMASQGEVGLMGISIENRR